MKREHNALIDHRVKYNAQYPSKASLPLPRPELVGFSKDKRKPFPPDTEVIKGTPDWCIGQWVEVRDASANEPSKGEIIGANEITGWIRVQGPVYLDIGRGVDYIIERPIEDLFCTKHPKPIEEIVGI